MIEALPLILTVFVGIAVAVTAAILLRLPLQLVSLAARISGAEREIAELDAKVKKALRRIGIEEKAARASASPPTPASPSSPMQPGLPFPDDEAEEDPLDSAARLARINGRLSRSRVRR